MAFSAGKTQNIKECVLEWRVRTKGEHKDLSEWSDIGYAYFENRPTVSIVSPSNGTEVKFSSFTLKFNSDSEGVTSWRGEIDAYVKENNSSTSKKVWERKYTNSGYGAPPYEWFINNLPNGAEVKGKIWVRAHVESEPTTITYRVKYEAPANPKISAQWNINNSSVTVDVTNIPEQGKPAVKYNTIQRRVNGGGWVTIADKIPPNTSWIDKYAPYSTDIEYQVIVTSMLGTQTNSRIVTPSNRPPVFASLVGDNGVISVKYNHEFSQEFKLENTERHFFLGRRKAVLYAGLENTRSYSIDFMLAAADKPYRLVEDIENLISAGTPILYRDMEEHYLWGRIDSVSCSRDRGTRQYKVSFTIEEVEKVAE